jgi:hypothetical protein
MVGSSPGACAAIQHASTVQSMNGVSGFFLLVPLLLWAVGLFALYWIIRLAVRHGVLDAQRRRPPGALKGPDVLE